MFRNSHSKSYDLYRTIAQNLGCLKSDVTSAQSGSTQSWEQNMKRARREAKMKETQSSRKEQGSA